MNPRNMSLSILDLPTEILVVIFADQLLSLRDVCSLSLVCGQLHFTALPIYLSSNGLDSSTGSADITIRTDRCDLLLALRLALFDISLDHINFIFPHPADTSVFSLLEPLRRVEGFLSRLPSIKSVSLQFSDYQYGYHHSGGSDEALRAWARAFGDLLNCIVQTQCTTLTVMHGSHFADVYFADAYQLVTAETVEPQRPVSWLGRLIYGRRKAPIAPGPRAPEFQRVSQQGLEYVEIALPRDFSRASRLTCMHIHSTMLMLPPCLSWTLEVLRSCPISQLSFSEVSLKLAVWKAVLALIATASPRVTSVSFINIEVTAECEIMAFLPRLPRLAELTISTVYASLRSIPILDGFFIGLSAMHPPHLPSLTHLRTGPFFTYYLLARGHLLPSLRTVTLLLNSGFVHLDLADLVRNLAPITSAIDAHPCCPPLTVAMTLSPVPGWRWDVQSWADVQPDLRPPLDRVERLEIEATISPDVLEDLVSKTTLRVAVFRRAKSVTMKLEPEAAVGTLPQQLARSIPRTEFLQAIEVNGKEYVLAER
ncbi:hypothetical protein DFH06DRAFT_1470926 [Mycena polygramma]|nr:hypothetical protein DFH06DRAFT_1470926 [Mycena polygramma]